MLARIKIDYKQFIRDRMWFGFWYVGGDAAKGGGSFDPYWVWSKVLSSVWMTKIPGVCRVWILYGLTKWV